MVTLGTLRRREKADILRLARLHGCRNVRVFGSIVTGEMWTWSSPAPCIPAFAIG